jgi:tetratricopeptide (TPR) repeat protein
MAKKRQIKGASAAPASLPTGAVLVGKLVAALGLPADAGGGRLQGNTAHRFFSGVRIDDEKIVEIFATLGDVLTELGFAPTTGWRPSGGLSAARRAGLALHHMVARWDETLAALRTGALRNVDPAIVVLAAARLVVVDVALRAAAWLAFVGIELGESPNPIAPPRGAEILSDLVGRTKLSHDDVAGRCHVARTTVDDWVHGARITDDNLSNLVLLVADCAQGEALLERTRRELAIAAVLAQLRARFGAALADEVDDLWRAAVRLAARFSRYMGRSRLLGEERFGPPSEVFLFGASCAPSQYVIANALKLDERPEWRAALEVGPAWTEFLVHAARIGRSGGGRELDPDPEIARIASLWLLARPRHSEPAAPPGWPVVRLVGDNATKASNRLMQVHDALDRGDPDVAVMHARRAAELTPLAWLAHSQLGVALAAALQVDEAITECEIAAGLASPSDKELAKVEVGIILTNAGRDEEARVHLEDLCVATAEPSTHLLYTLGVIRMRCGRFADALASFSMVIARDEHHPLALDCGAHCAFAVGDRRLGIEYAKRANLVGQHETYNAWRAGLYGRGAK